ncbi:hypothetical protein CIK05_06615 [Bdellovibrio sp. qaytius]|nr:hypothetical protein CIK05_06615 [Bdellovibrio sp. qaytius]
MSEAKKEAPTLFFVKNFTHQFGPVEKFLKKRGYNVVIEIDVKSAIDRILETNPEYIFLAWDHKNENIRAMPKTIYQSCTGQVVPFIMSTQRDQIIQLESSGFENKLYPPLSGPAIIRVISKYEKKNQIFEQINRKPVEKKKESDMIQVKSFFTQDNDEGPEINLKKSNSMDDNERQMIANRSRGRLNMFVPQKQKKSKGIARAERSASSKPKGMSQATQDGIKAKMMSAIEEELRKVKSLTREQREAAKKNLMAALEQQLANDVSPGDLMLAIEEEIAKMPELTLAEQQNAKGKLIEIMDDELAKAMAKMEAEFARGDVGGIDLRDMPADEGNGSHHREARLQSGNGDVMADIDDDEMNGSVDHQDGDEEDADGLDTPMSEKLPREAKGLSKEQIEFLDESFNETIKPEMFDVIEAYADQKSEHLDLTQTSQIYILIIQELEWTGYLAVASENFLDVASAQDILNNWIKQMIRIEKIDQDETDGSAMPDTVLLEIRVPKVDFADLCSYKAEFFKEITYEDKKTMLGFFSFSPYQVINSVHLAFDMLELPVEFLQPNKDLPFDVNLYLPENKKFILYLRPGSHLDDVQVTRLQTRKVKYIFSHLEHELALLKYKAEFNIKGLIESYKQIKGSKK